MVKAGKWIAKHRFIILLLGILLLIPSFIGMAKTRINYDLLSYLPESLETVEGQDVMVDEYGMGAFAMVVVEDTDMKDIQKLADQFNKVDHVEKVLWYDNYTDFMEKDIRQLRKALDILEKSDNELQYQREMKASLFPDGCSQNCYYR